MFHGAMVTTKADLEAALDDACAIALCVMHCVSDIVLQGMAPGTLVFGCDVNVNLPVLTDIVAVSTNQQLQTDAGLLRKNQQRTCHECEVGQQVHVDNHFSLADELKQALGWTLSDTACSCKWHCHHSAQMDAQANFHSLH